MILTVHGNEKPAIVSETEMCVANRDSSQTASKLIFAICHAIFQALIRPMILGLSHEN